MQPPFADALTLILPTPSETALLRACLGSGETARRAFALWWRDLGSFETTLRGGAGDLRRLLPLLHRSVERNGIAADRTLLTYLRTARAREELRSRSYREVCAEVLTAVAAGGVDAIVLRGAALAETVYDEPWLRHCHDLDLLIPEHDRDTAVRVLAARGLTAVSPAPDVGGDVRVFHASHLPVALHTTLFQMPYYNAPLETLRDRARPFAIGGRAASAPSSADSLVHVCGHAASASSVRSVRWVCDAWHVLARAPDLDWAIVLDVIAHHRLALPLFVTLRYLDEALSVPVPAHVLDRLASDAAELDAAGREAALWSARVKAGPDGIRRLLRSVRGWRARVAVARWCLVPPARYVRQAYGVRSPWHLPAYYLYRLLRFVVARLRARLSDDTTPMLP